MPELFIIKNNSMADKKTQKATSSKKTFVLRMDESMYALIEKWAADEFRSVNGQIEYLLSEALNRSGRKKKQDSSEKK